MAAFRAIKSRRGPLPFRYVLLLSFVFFIFSTAAGLWIVNKGIQPTLMRYADSQTRKIAPMVISKAVREVIPNVKDIKEITQTEPDGAGGTITQFDVEIINHIMMEMASQVQKNLKSAELGNLEALAVMWNLMKIEQIKEKALSIQFHLGKQQIMHFLGNSRTTRSRSVYSNWRCTDQCKIRD